jgi:hypothetical protein
MTRDIRGMILAVRGISTRFQAGRSRNSLDRRGASGAVSAGGDEHQGDERARWPGVATARYRDSPREDARRGPGRGPMHSEIPGSCVRP